MFFLNIYIYILTYAPVPHLLNDSFMFIFADICFSFVVLVFNYMSICIYAFPEHCSWNHG